MYVRLRTLAWGSDPRAGVGDRRECPAWTSSSRAPGCPTGEGLDTFIGLPFCCTTQCGATAPNNDVRGLRYAVLTTRGILLLNLLCRNKTQPDHGRP
jgi:hypothetical protein